MSEYEEWQMDLRPPTRVPPESAPLSFRKTFVLISRRLGKAFSDLGKHIHIIVADFVPPDKPKSKVPPKNHVYPTSFDSWCNEYNQPLRSSQINRTRRPYRR